MKTIIGICTFGNLRFSELTVNSVFETVKEHDVEIALIVGKPGDAETLEWAKQKRESSGGRLHYLPHKQNMGFPSACNDMWDISRGFDNLIIMGNDVIAYPGAIDKMIATAEQTDWEWICASMFDAKSLVNHYPELKKYFTGEGMAFTDFDTRPWEAHAANVMAIPDTVGANVFSDVQNLCLFKRSVFDKIGYFDANFWPNGYFSDNDYARSAVNAGLKGCALPAAVYFHFWSRTIHQETGPRSLQFERNLEFYRTKWGGDFGHETFTVPFNGQPYELPTSRNLPCGPITIPGTAKITSRDDEKRVASYWASR